MKRLTRSEDCSEIKGDSLYLPWTMMKWNFIGEIREYNIKKSDLCSTDNSISVFFPSKGGLRKFQWIISIILFFPASLIILFDVLFCRNIPVGRVHGDLSEAEPGPGPVLQNFRGSGGDPPPLKQVRQLPRQSLRGHMDVCN